MNGLIHYNMKTKYLFLSTITVLFMALGLNAQNAENDSIFKMVPFKAFLEENGQE